MTTHYKTADINFIRKHNLSLVLNLVHEAGTISRASIVQQTGLSATTVSALANVLLESGFIHEAGTGTSRGGRRPILLQFDYGYRHVLGVDIGATHLTAVAMDLGGAVVARELRAFNVIDDPEGTIRLVRTLIENLISENRLKMPGILGMGLAIPTPLDGEHLDQFSSVILPNWQGYDLYREVVAWFEAPVWIDNDANAGANAEKWWGKGRTCSNLAFIKLGTGIGSGLILNNKIYRGDGGTAGEIGHTTIDPQGPICRCGNRGCLESFVGIPALLAEIARLSPSGPPAPQTILEVVDAAVAGDPIARHVIENAGTYLGIAIANLLNLFNPGLVVLGGQLTAAGDLLLRTVEDSIKTRAMPKVAQEAEITTSTLGENSIAMGAATLAIYNAFQPSQLAQTLNGSRTLYLAQNPAG